MREIFNQEQKMNFINSMPDYSNERIKKNYENLFYTISKYELQLQKDFCDMNIPEVKMVVVSIGFLSAASLYTTTTMLRDYNNWCVANGKTNNENPLLKLQSNDFDMSFAIQSKLLKSPEHLLEILQKAYGDEETPYQKQSKLIALLLYSGFSTEEIKHFKTADIEIFKKIISDSLEYSKFSDIILKLMQQCSELYEIRSYNGRGGSEKIDYLVDSEYILRSKANSRADPQGILANSVVLDRIRDINTQYAQNTGTLLELTVDRISRSGVFYKLYQHEQKGQEITSPIIYQMFEMEYQNEMTARNETGKKIRDFENWKKAFEL